MTDRLKGKTCIVTGAASGLGESTARMFAAEGAAVACVDLDGDGVQKVADDLQAAGAAAVAIQADLTDPVAAERMTDQALADFDTIDVVFACAGIAGAGNAADTSIEQWDRVIAVNLTSKWLSFRFALPSMVARGSGSIIVQSSIGGILGVPGIFPYAAAKGGCISMVKQTAVEYAPKGVRVNGIAPGTIPTPLVYESYRGGGGMSAADGEAGVARAHERYPLGRLGTAEEVAYLATYIASDEAAWTTGHIFVIDGGISVQ